MGGWGGGGGGGGARGWQFQQIWWKACIGFLFICLYPPTDQCPDVLGFVPACSVSSSSTLQIIL